MQELAALSVLEARAHRTRTGNSLVSGSFRPNPDGTTLSPLPERIIFWGKCVSEFSDSEAASRMAGQDTTPNPTD